MALKLLGSLESSGGNVGIGTSSPSEKLHVVGNAKFYSGTSNGNISVGRGTNQELVLNVSDNINSITAYQDSDSNGAHGFVLDREFDGSGDNYFAISKGGSTQMHIDTSGKVGIGTTSPDAPLVVYQTGDVWHTVIGNDSGQIRFGGQTSSGAVIQSRTQSGTSRDLYIQRDGGNVGIGTTGPLEKLHVAGKINSSNNIVSNATYTMFTGRSSRTTDDYGGLNKQYFKANLVTPGPNTTGEASAHGIADLRFQLANSAGNTGMSDIMTLRSGGHVGIGTPTPNEKLTVAGNIHAYAPSGINAGLFASTAAGATSIAIRSSGVTSFNAGNVGIGTAGPTAKLHVKDGTASVLVGHDVTYGQNYSTIGFGGLENGSNRIFAGYNGSGPYDDIYYAAGTGKGHQFRTNGSGGTKVIITSAGNVGIGTTSPGEKLHIVGGHLLLNNALELRSKDTSGNVKTITRVNSSNELEYGWSGAGAVKFMGGGSYTERMRIHTNGSVGIGTNSPDYPLTVYNASGAVLKLDSGGANNSQIRFHEAGTLKGAITYIPANDQIRIYNVGDVVTIGTSNVGIGETNPTSGLVVRKDTEGGRGGEISIVNYATNTIGNETALNFGLEASTYNADLGNAQIKARVMAANAASDMIFSTWNGSSFGERMRIDSAGAIKFNAYGAGILKTNASGVVSLDTNTYATQTWVGEQNYASDSAISTALASYLPLAGGTMTGTLTGTYGIFGNHLYVNQDANLTSQALQVNGFIDITDVTGTALRWYDGTTFRGGLGTNAWAMSGSDSDLAMYVSGDNSFFVQTNNVTRAEFDSGGLEVTGNITSTNLNVGNAIYHDGDNNTYIWFTTDRIRIDAGGVNKFDSNNTYATETYVGTQISNLVDSSPSTLNTLNELAAALGDDASFSTTVTNSIATKLPLAGGNLTGNLGINSSSPAAPLDVQPASDYKVTKVGDDRTSHYKLTGLADHTLTLACSSYHSSEVVITAHQTNGGANNNLYIRGMWTNNHTAHHWHEIENIGGLTGSSFTITNGQSGDTTNSGELEIVHDYSSGSFGQMVVRVTDHYGTHSYTIS